MSEKEVTNNEKRDQANSFVELGIGAAVGAAIIPLPVADAIAITGIQLIMVTEISELFGKSIKKLSIKSGLSVGLAYQVGILTWSFVKSIPGLGTAAGIMGQMVIAGSVTAALGYGFTEMCVSGEEITNKNLKKAVKRNSNKGKIVASEIKKYGEAIKKINFRVKKTKIKEQLIVNFNLAGLKNPRLQILSLSMNFSDEIKLNPNSNSFTYSASELKKGDYYVTLKSKDIPDIGIKITKI